MTEKARILIFTGDGKGKTTAALGLALRAAGHGMRVLVLQFVKGGQQTGELAAARQIPGFEIVQRGCGFVPATARAQNSTSTGGRPRRSSVRPRDALLAGAYDVVVLDEICLRWRRRLISEQSALEVVGLARAGTVLVLTGRGATRRVGRGRRHGH